VNAPAGVHAEAYLLIAEVLAAFRVGDGSFKPGDF